MTPTQCFSKMNYSMFTSHVALKSMNLSLSPAKDVCSISAPELIYNISSAVY